MRLPSGILAFCSVAGLFVLALGFLVCTMDKFALHMFMHPIHSPALDQFFRWSTHLADGVVPTVLALILLVFGRWRSFLMMGMGCTIGALITQTLKRLPFAHMDRPFMFKEQLVGSHWVDGLTLHHHFSFPSGHATAAFNMCFALAVLFPGWKRGALLALLAALLAYSRVYLSQHFTEDILAGSMIGTATSFLVYLFVYRSGFATRPWLDRGLRYPRRAP